MQARGQVVIEVGPVNNLVLTDGRNPVGRRPAEPGIEPAVAIGRDRLVFAPTEHLVGEVPLVGKSGVDGVETGVEQDDCQQPAVREARLVEVNHPERHQGDNQEEHRHEDVVVVGKVEGRNQDGQVDGRGDAEDPEGVTVKAGGVFGEPADR